MVVSKNTTSITPSTDTRGHLLAKVKGKSMRPLFAPESLVRIVFCPVEALRRGDVAVCREGEVLICHRVISRVTQDGRKFVRVKGDTAFSFDLPVENRSLVGKVVTLRRFGLDVRLDNFPARALGLLCSCITPFVMRGISIIKNLAES